MEYVIKKASIRPSLKGVWTDAAWRDIPVATLNHFLKQSSTHHPRVEAKLTYTDDSLYVFFRVWDQYVRCTRTDYQSSVCKDSCVEFFIKPRPDRGYLNFEINCGGTMLLYYIEDATRTQKGFAKSSAVPWEWAGTIQIYHSMPKIVYPEMTHPVEWTLEYQIPFKLFENYMGTLGTIQGQIWRGNLYKCADESSHPHWASWAPLSDELNFHLPDYFAPMKFD